MKYDFLIGNQAAQMTKDDARLWNKGQRSGEIIDRISVENFDGSHWYKMSHMFKDDLARLLHFNAEPNWHGADETDLADVGGFNKKGK